jgi:hypothetical protein
MAFKKLTNSLEDISDKLQDYGNSTIAYYKLHLFKSSMKGAISLVNLLVLGSIFLLVLLFLSLGAAFLIGNSLGSVSFGFFIMGGFYILVLIAMVIFGRKAIERAMLIKFSELFYDEDETPPGKAVESEAEVLRESETLEKT